MKTRSRDWSWLWIGALLVLEIAFCIADLVWTDQGLVSTEERFNARAGMQFLCGHGDRAEVLQYTDFCGGCTAESWMAVPSYALFGGTILAWKLVPLVFHVGIVVLVAWWARKFISLEAAIFSLLLFLSAPAFYRSLASTGFGNHAEASLFPLVALALLMVLYERFGKHRIWQNFSLLLCGVVMGLGIWFSYGTVHAVPALLVLAYVSVGKRSVWVLPGIPLGMLPWWHHHRQNWPSGSESWSELPVGGSTLGQIDWAPPGSLARWVFVDPTASLWPAEEPGFDQVLWWFVLLFLAAMGLRALAARRERGPLRWWPLLTLGGLVMSWWLRHDLWKDNFTTPIESYDWFNMRYRAPLLPLLFMGAVAALHVRLPSRKLIRIGLWSVIAVGLGHRIGAWESERVDVLAGVYAPDGRADRTVPSGLPVQRNTAAMHRPQDLEAALEFIDDHIDVRQECRNDHFAELGRRTGLALRDDPDRAGLDALVSRWPDWTPAERAALALGLQKGLEGGEDASVSLPIARARLFSSLPELRLP